MSNKKLALMLAVILCASNTLYAAPAPEPVDKKAAANSVLGQNNTTVTATGAIPDKPAQELTGTGPVAEGNTVSSGSVSVIRPCRDFEFSGDPILPVHRADHYECPPGYRCKGVVGGFQCQWENLSNLSADSPSCSNERCYR